jgi:hypothetical protein
MTSEDQSWNEQGYDTQTKADEQPEDQSKHQLPATRHVPFYTGALAVLNFAPSRSPISTNCAARAHTPAPRPR